MRVKFTAALPALLLVSACVGLPNKIDHSVDDAESKATRMSKDVGRIEASTKATSSVVHEDGMWLAKSSVKLAQQDNLPPLFYEPATFDRTVGSLAEFAERITIRSGMPIKVTSDAASAAFRNLNPTSTAVAQPGSPLPLAQGPALAPAPGYGPGTPPSYGMGPGSAQHRPEVRIVYQSGNLKGLFDTVAARFGVYWKYDQGTVRFFYTDTRSFQISAIPGDSALTATVASGSTGSGTPGGGATAVSSGSTSNSNNTEMKSQLSVFTSIEKSIGAMLSPVGKVVASPATGSISVTDTPDVLERVTQFVDSENKTLSRQVMVNVTVLSVNLGDSENYGLNWNLVYGDLFRRYGIQNSFPSDPNSSSFSAAILNTANSKFAGTSLIINALSGQGKVRRETTASVVALNNQPVPVQVAKQTSYLASSQTTITANVGSSTSLTPGVVTSGFNMSILPRVLNNGTVMMQFSTDMSSLRGIRKVAAGGSLIETPELDTRNFLQRVAMKSGETLVISGFEQIEDDLSAQGVGTATNFLLGGGWKAQTGKEVIVILITPVTMGGA